MKVGKGLKICREVVLIIRSIRSTLSRVFVLA